jgi:hypothetical protein
MQSESQTAHQTDVPDIQETTLHQLRKLIRHYQTNPSHSIAMSVVNSIESLCRNPEIDTDLMGSCGLLRLRTHWYWLAQRDLRNALRAASPREGAVA